jgi:predicted HTH domain antitoxin
MSITLDLPDEITEADVRRELAVGLYRTQKLSLGRAAAFAAMDSWEFRGLLKERDVPYMSEEEFIEEIEDAIRRGDDRAAALGKEPAAKTSAPCPS